MPDKLYLWSSGVLPENEVCCCGLGEDLVGRDPSIPSGGTHDNQTQCGETIEMRPEQRHTTQTTGSTFIHTCTTVLYANTIIVSTLTRLVQWPELPARRIDEQNKATSNHKCFPWSPWSKGPGAHSLDTSNSVHP